MEEDIRINAVEEPGEPRLPEDTQPDVQPDVQTDVQPEERAELPPAPQPRWVNRQFKALRRQQERLQRQMAETQAREWMRSDPEYLALQQKAQAYEQAVFQNVFQQDIAAIQKAFPDFQGSSVDELGEPFAALRANGVDAVTAYAALQAANPAAPVMGAMKQTPAEKEFYSREEYEALVAAHPELLEDAAFVNSIIDRSMPKW